MYWDIGLTAFLFFYLKVLTSKTSIATLVSNINTKESFLKEVAIISKSIWQWTYRMAIGGGISTRANDRPSFLSRNGLIDLEYI